MKFGYTILYVDDVVKTVGFYEKAFGLKVRFMHESNTYAEMETGQTRLAFACTSLAKENGFDFAENKSLSPPPFEIALVTSDVENAFNTALDHGAIAQKKPAKKPWGQIVGFLKDCNGFIVEICSPMD